MDKRHEIPIVLGMDILPQHSSLSSKEVKFAVTILDQKKEVLLQNTRANLDKVIRLAWQYHVKYIAVDNITEISTNLSDIYKFAQRLPHDTTIVVVTGGPNQGFTSVSRLAQKYHLNQYVPAVAQRKLNSLETSEVVGRLCQLGVGEALHLFSDEIKVKISRARPVGPGGWSQQRYHRNKRLAVLHASRSLEQFLKEKKYSYDVFTYQDRRVFLIKIQDTDTLVQLRRFLTHLRNEMIKIQVSRVPLSSLDFQPLKYEYGSKKAMVPNLIVGVDPGMTTGLATLNTKGKIVYTTSKREFSTNDIIRTIYQIGHPIAVASDVNPIPRHVQKIARTFGAKLLSPYSYKPAASDKRVEIEERFGEDSVQNLDPHERDALFAAAIAYQQIKGTLQKIHRAVRENPEFLEWEAEIQRLVIKSGLSLQDALKIIKERIDSEKQSLDLEKTKEQENEVRITTTKREEELKEDIQKLYRRNQELQEELNYYVELTRLQRQEIAQLRDLYDKAKMQQNLSLYKEKRFQELKREIHNLERSLRDLTQKLQEKDDEIKKLLTVSILWRKNIFIPLRVIPKFSQSEITRNYKDIEENEFILFLDCSGGGSKTAEYLATKKPYAVLNIENGSHFSDMALEKFFDKDIPVISAPLKKCTLSDLDKLSTSDLFIYQLDEYYFVPREPLYQ